MCEEEQALYDYDDRKLEPEAERHSLVSQSAICIWPKFAMHEPLSGCRDMAIDWVGVAYIQSELCGTHLLYGVTA